MKILFIGCVESSRQLLLALLEQKFEIVGVVTKSQSKCNSDFVDLSPICQAHKIPFCYFGGHDWNVVVNFSKERAPDILYCMGWSYLLPESLIQLSPLGAVGFHPASLPQNRGRHPIIWALALGLEKTASTFFMLEAQADAGDIVSQQEVLISDNDRAASLYKKIMECATKQLVALTYCFQNDMVSRISQKGLPSNTWRKRRCQDGIIDFRMSARNIYNLVRALSPPYPGACFLYRNQAYTVWDAYVEESLCFKNIEPGKILSVASEKCFCIQTGDGVLKVVDCTPIVLTEGDYLL